jgi:hypothetical protein
MMEPRLDRSQFPSDESRRDPQFTTLTTLVQQRTHAAGDKGAGKATNECCP